MKVIVVGVGVGGIGVSRQKQKYDRIQNSRRTDSKLKSLTNSSVCLFSPMTIGYDGQTNGVLTILYVMDRRIRKN